MLGLGSRYSGWGHHLEKQVAGICGGGRARREGSCEFREGKQQVGLLLSGKSLSDVINQGGGTKDGGRGHQKTF